MFRLPHWMLMAVVVLVTAGSMRAQDTKADQEHLAGTWVVQSAREEGKDVVDLQKAIFTFSKDGRLTLKLAGATEPIDLRFALTADKVKGIELSAPPLADKYSGISRDRDRDRGIYKLEGDTLTLSICDGPGADSPAPKDFNVQGRFVTIVVLKRQGK